MNFDLKPTVDATAVVPGKGAKGVKEEDKKSVAAKLLADKANINQLATHLPDGVCFSDPTRQLPYQNTVQGVVMFLDISGFTALTEKYSMNTKNGTDQLTKTLSGYMGALVQEIISADGDVLKFAGDAILCLWTVDSFLKMRVTVAHVIKCALNIQKTCGEWLTSIGIILRVKIGISAGEVLVTYLGNNEFCHNVTMGRAIEAVNAAEKFCVSGDVVVSPSAWCHCAGLPVETELQDDKKHVKVLDIDESAHSIVRDYVKKRTLSLSEYADQKMAKEDEKDKDRDEEKSPEKKRRFFKATVKPKPVDHDEMRVRKAVTEKLTARLVKRLRLYVATPVLRKLDEGQPLEYLSEMRQVTILFINLVLSECTKYELCSTLQKAFNIIYKDVKEMDGCMNKIFTFDKGCTFLVIFGLPGFKHENDCARALHCANQITCDVTAVQKIVECSIGVTTGSTFCGVVGHEHRHEYTVIGRKVNMAARLMMAYVGKVTCDNETYHHSKLHKANFILLELKTMKGLSNIGTIREFNENKSRKGTIEALEQQEFEFPLIGREKEVEIFLEALEGVLNRYGGDSQRQVICLKGEAGVGKSRLLDSFIVKAFREHVRMIVCNLSMQDQKIPYYTVKYLLMELLEFDYDTPHQEREHILFKMFSDPFILDNLALLNDILHLKLPSDKIHDTDDRNGLLIKLLMRMVHEISKTDLTIFAIDDCHFMDMESWPFISLLGSNNNTLVLVSVKGSASGIQHPEAQKLLSDKSTLTIPIGGMSSQYLGYLACQLLGVVMIPKKLEGILIQKSHGVPSWCEQLLYSILYDGLVKVESIETLENEADYIVPPKQYQIRKKSDEQEKREKEARKSSITLAGDEEEAAKSMDDGKMICVLDKSVALSEVRIPDSIKGMIQARIDRMVEVDQMIVKTAAILGLSFSHKMLDTLLPTKVSQNYEAKTRIGASGLFECVRTVAQMHGNSCVKLANEVRSRTYYCMCKDGDAGVVFPVDRSILNCQMIMFKSSTIQETAYEMFTENLRRQLHIKAAKFLESEAHKCQACGGGEFVPTEMLHEPDSNRTQNQLEFLEDSAGAGASGGGGIKRGSKAISALRKMSMRRPSNEPRFSVQQSDGGTTDGGGNLGAVAVSQPRHSIVSGSGRPSLTLPTADTEISSNQSLQGNEDQVEEEEDDTQDRRECKCMQVLSTVYPRLVRHWKAAGYIEKTVHFLLEAASASIGVDDNLQALSYLNEVRNILVATKKGKNPFEGEVTHIETYMFDEWDEARMESLTGQALFHMGQAEESIPHFHKALRILGSTQPRSKFAIYVNIMHEGLRQWRHHKFPGNYVGKGNQLLSHRTVEQARCLSHVFHDYINKGNQNRALLTVLQQVNKAETADTDLHELIIAYTCMMECCQTNQWQTLGRKYEVKALKRCEKAGKTVENQMTAAYLFNTALSMRLTWGRISEAIDAGYESYAILRRVHDNDMRIQLLPVLAQALLLGNRIVDVVEALEHLEYTSTETDCVGSRAWYFACCMDLLLEAGLQLEDYQNCNRFAKEAKDDPSFKSDRLPLYYLACCLCLWHQRRGNLDKIGQWQRVAVDNTPTTLNSFMAVHGFVKMLECKLLALSKFIHENNITRVRQVSGIVMDDFKVLENISKTMPVFKARYLHYNGYYMAMQLRHSKAKDFLKQAINVARKQENMLEYEWLNHSLQVWFDTQYEKKQASFWLNHAQPGENMVDWHAASDVNRQLIQYSLPLPHWFD